jgi:hypothetical protein
MNSKANGVFYLLQNCYFMFMVAKGYISNQRLQMITNDYKCLQMGINRNIG